MISSASALFSARGVPPYPGAPKAGLFEDLILELSIPLSADIGSDRSIDWIVSTESARSDEKITF